MTNIDIGIDAKKREEIVGGLSREARDVIIESRPGIEVQIALAPHPTSRANSF